MPSVVVFCGSRTGASPEYASATETLGNTLVTAGYDLIYGGGSIGLMGVLDRSVLNAGGRVTGVITHSLAIKEIVQTDATTLHIVDTMHQRKAMMADLADAFLAIPGGFGTCDELFEILTWAQLGIHRKPIVLWNMQQFFDPLLAMIEQMVVSGFLSRSNQELLRIAPDMVSLLKLLQTPVVPVDALKWADRDDR